jgi:altronate hydrolase/altronate dehydratase small subunit
MRCFQVNAEDNVATALEDLEPGPVTVMGAHGGRQIQALEPIALGHKLSLQGIGAGDLLIKYGVPIGVAITDIPAGHWVHLHNCRSQVDERSSHLDSKTGAALDTVYG